MKLKDMLKKFSFLNKLDLTDEVKSRAAVQLASTLKGDEGVHITPLAKKHNPITFLVEWDLVFEENKHKMNDTLLDLERSNRSKFGPRSIAVPWSARIADFKTTYSNQDSKHIPKFKHLDGPANLSPISLARACDLLKSSTSSGFPFLEKKSKRKDEVRDNLQVYLDRKDPAIVYTRTAENRKTRNVWGYPIADSLYEMMFYYPILLHSKERYCRASLVSPDAVSVRLTEMILKAISSDRIIYSVDFQAFDASVKFQYIIEAFKYIERCFDPMFQSFVAYVCERFYSLSIITPSALYTGNHGIPSGSTFTNEIDSIVQLGIAMLSDFISEFECQVQGDDGVYIMQSSNISEFESNFEYAGLKLSKDKSSIASNYAMFCQMLFHIDYIKDGQIGGIYPVYRAINRILFQERFVNFKKAGIKGKDYYGIRCLTILENCKHHPLFEDLVKFVLKREKFALDVSDDGLMSYVNSLNSSSSDTVSNLNHQYGSNVMGIRNFEAYKLVTLLLATGDYDCAPEVDSED